MNLIEGFRQPGVLSALGAAMLFGAGTPIAKLFLDAVDPWMLAGLFYLGSGLGLTFYRFIKKAPSVRLPKNETLWFAGAIMSGGIIAPVLFMFGLTAIPASGVSLLLNTESMFTALLAWFAFKENFDKRIALGMVAILAGAIILSVPSEVLFTALLPTLFILSACFAWGLDNNLTRKVSLTDATWIASVKGWSSGTVNLTLAYILGASLPSLPNIAGSMLVGFLAYGVSLTLFVVGLRHLGTARTSAYFSIAPFFGATLALLMGEPVTTPLIIATILMAIGIWLHLTEQHQHSHTHEAMIHSHEHIHDEHHGPSHNHPIKPDAKRPNLHVHKPMTHTHVHFPDVHHRHDH